MCRVKIFQFMPEDQNSYLLAVQYWYINHSDCGNWQPHCTLRSSTLLYIIMTKISYQIAYISNHFCRRKLSMKIWGKTKQEELIWWFQVKSCWEQNTIHMIYQFSPVFVPRRYEHVLGDMKICIPLGCTVAEEPFSFLQTSNKWKIKPALNIYWHF